MQVSVTFRHMETEEGVKDYVKEKVERLQKYIENPREVHVVLSVEKFRHSAELTITGDGVPLNSEGRNRDLYTAIDQMVEKMDRQIRARKGKGERKRVNPTPLQISSPQEGISIQEDGEAEISSPIERRRVPAKPMSLEEAIAQLQLSKEDFLFFIHSDSGQMNVLRRRDRGYEWMEPSYE
ncbi:MAG: ribosome-associated translation inhibitor RaiA [Thermodesulfobacteriota bacterium]|nr:ribosome-associated translation inhibitor RaiA [Thermodesulfobacteriota bacterium]